MRAKRDRCDAFGRRRDCIVGMSEELQRRSQREQSAKTATPREEIYQHTKSTFCKHMQVIVKTIRLMTFSSFFLTHAHPLSTRMSYAACPGHIPAVPTQCPGRGWIPTEVACQPQYNQSWEWHKTTGRVGI